MRSSNVLVGIRVWPTVLSTALLAACLVNCTAEVGSNAQSCDAVTPCGNDDVCDDGTCAVRCTSEPCDSGLCDVETGLCVDCLGDEDCSDGRVCNAFTGACVSEVPGCTTNDDCFGLLCDVNKAVCVECLTSADCAGGTCDPGSAVCTAPTRCTSDDNCPNGACLLPDGVCVACVSDGQCDGGICDTQTHACVAACEDTDATEPADANNPITLNGVDSSHEGQICGGDVDAFVVHIDADNSTLDVDIAIEGAGHLGLTLLSRTGTQLQTATPVGNTITLSRSGLAVGDYTLVLAGDTASDEAHYLLHSVITAPAVCVAVDNEPNDANGNAIAITANGQLNSGNLCGADTDRYAVTFAQNDNINISVVTDGTVTARLETTSGTVVATGTSIAQSNVAAGSYIIVVAGNGPLAYTVRVTASAAPPVCTERDAEPNNTEATALFLSDGNNAGTLCNADVDLWRFAASANDDIALSSTGTGITLELIRTSDGVTLGQGASISVVNVAAGGYRVAVRTTPGTSTDYNVNLVRTPEPVVDPCTENGLEPDNNAPRALTVDGTPQTGRICTGDTDFFRFTVATAGSVRVVLRFNDAIGDLDLEIADNAGVLIAKSSGIINDETVTVNLAAGTYLARVVPFQTAVNTYSIEAAAVGCTADDILEVNNTMAQASPIGAGSFSAVRCPGDDDFYAIRLEAGDTLSLNLTTNTPNNVAMSLVSSTGALLLPDTATANGRTLSTSGLAAGRYGVRVSGGASAGVNYTLQTAITASPQRCIDDGATPNNSANEPFVVQMGGLVDGSMTLSPLVLCNGDDNDWFAFDVPTAQRFSVTLKVAPTADLDIEILEPRGNSGFTRQLARTVNVDSDDVISGYLDAPGRVLLRVLGYMPSPENYTLNIAALPTATGACVNDRFDSFSATGENTTVTRHNDIATDAVVLAAGEQFSKLQICAGESDWYRVSLAQGQVLAANAGYVHSTGRDLDMRLYGPAGQTTPLSTCTHAGNTTGTNLSCISAGVDGSEDLRVIANSAGDYFIEVFGFIDSENSYTLSVTTP